MTMSPKAQKTHFLHDVETGEPIAHGTLAYFEERLRNELFEFVIQKFLHERAKGLTKADLARRLHKRPEVINRLLSSPGNWTISTISNLLLGICAEELKPESISVLNRSSRNYQALDYLKEIRPTSVVLPPSEPNLTTQTAGTSLWTATLPSALQPIVHDPSFTGIYTLTTPAYVSARTT